MPLSGRTTIFTATNSTSRIYNICVHIYTPRFSMRLQYPLSGHEIGKIHTQLAWCHVPRCNQRAMICHDEFSRATRTTAPQRQVPPLPKTNAMRYTSSGSGRKRLFAKRIPQRTAATSLLLWPSENFGDENVKMRAAEIHHPEKLSQRKQVKRRSIERQVRTGQDILLASCPKQSITFKKYSSQS